MKTTLLDLPQECLSLIFARTSPLYVLRCSLVCKVFNNVANSDLVWRKLLPSDLHHLIQDSSVYPMKHVVLLLCRTFMLLGDGNMSVSLDLWTGKKSYVMSAKTLKFAPNHCWKWESPLPKSRFLEVTKLMGARKLKVTGRISTTLLSPNTTYHIHFSFMIEPSSCGFEEYPVRVFVSTIHTNGAYFGGRHHNSKTFFLKAPAKGRRPGGDIFDVDTSQDTFDRPYDEEIEDHFNHGSDAPRWLKIYMGKYFHKGDSDVAMLEMTLMGTEISLRKHGLVVHAIELQPVD